MWIFLLERRLQQGREREKIGVTDQGEVALTFVTSQRVKTYTLFEHKSQSLLSRPENIIFKFHIKNLKDHFDIF